jgi:hypothetical protein
MTFIQNQKYFIELEVQNRENQQIVLVHGQLIAPPQRYGKKQTTY